MHPDDDHTGPVRATEDLLEDAVARRFAGRVALVSSFGAESAVLLHLVARVDPATPVLFLDTRKLFGETLRYRETLVRHLGLRDVRDLTPDVDRLAAADPDGTLWSRDPDACCRLRKVEPLAAALDGFDAWINGRKRYHGDRRAELPMVEADGSRTKFNPLAHWSPEMVADHARRHGLPVHPLVAQGFPSIGCIPCTQPNAPGNAVRAGRWRGRSKTECGIHLPRPGRGAPVESSDEWGRPE